MREQAMATVVDVFRRDEDVAVIMADISLDYLRPAMEHDPSRAINVGIMEQTAVGIAAGFALEGYHPIVHTLAPFLAERPLEQIKLDFGYQGLGGLFVSAGASYDYGESGGTHHSGGDVQALGSIPRVEVLVPGTAEETATLIRRSYANGRPTYLRTSTVENDGAVELAPGGLTAVRRGAAVTVIAAGPFLTRTLAALEGVDATVLYATTLVPLDAETLAREAAPAAEVVLVEPVYEGTTAAQVAAALSHRPIRLLSIGVPRRFLERYGTAEQHDAELGLDACAIRDRIHAFVG
ncbi:MAG: transketolase family protein [Gaiellaceae bacterium]